MKTQSEERSPLRPRAFPLRNSSIKTPAFRALKDPLNLELANDFFLDQCGRSPPARRRKLWRALLRNGDIYKKSYGGLHCVGLSTIKRSDSRRPMSRTPTTA